LFLNYSTFDIPAGLFASQSRQFIGHQYQYQYQYFSSTYDIQVADGNLKSTPAAWFTTKIE